MLNPTIRFAKSSFIHLIACFVNLLSPSIFGMIGVIHTSADVSPSSHLPVSLVHTTSPCLSTHSITIYMNIYST